MNAQRAALTAADDQAHIAVGEFHGAQLIILAQRDGDQARLAQVGELAVRRALDHAVSGHHDQIVLLQSARDRDHGGHLFVARNLQQVDDGHAARGASRFGDLVALEVVDAAAVGEEHDFVMRVDDDEALGEVLLAGRHAADALAAAVLRAVGALGQALDVAEMRHGYHHVVGLDEVLDVDLALHHGQLRAALVGKLVADLGHLLLDDAHEQSLIGQQALVIGDVLFQLVIFGLQLVAFQTGQAGQAHVQNGLCLLLGESEALHQSGTRGRGIAAAPDDGHDFIDVVQRLEQTLQDVRARLGLVQVVFGAAGDDVLLVGDVVVEHLPQGEHLGLAVHQGKHVGAEGLLHGGVLVEVVEHHGGVYVALELDDDAHAVAVALVANIGDAVQALLMHQLGDLLHQLGLVDHVGDFRDHDAAAVLAHGLDLGLGAHQNAAPARVIGRADAALPQNDAAGGEVRPLDKLHQVLGGAVGMVDHVNAAVHHLAQVVRGDVGGHAHGDAVGAVDQQVGVTAGHDGGLEERFVEVGIEVHGVFVDLADQVQRELAHARFGITHGGRPVAVDGAEVALALHEGIADIEVLRQTHHGVVDGAVAMGMVFAQHVAHDAGALAKRLVGRHAQFVHGVQDAPVHGLEAVAHIRQGTVDDDRHRVADERFFHLVLKVDGDELVVDGGSHGGGPSLL